MAILTSNINMRPILVFLYIWLYIWLFSPVSIIIASALLSLDLLGAFIVKVTANPVEVASVPNLLISPAFSHLRLNTFCTFFDALHLAHVATVAQKLTELKIRETIVSLNESVIRQGERTLKFQLENISKRQRNLSEAEMKMEEQENHFFSLTDSMLSQQQQALDIIAAEGRKKMNRIAAMTPYNQRQTDHLRAKKERMRGIITKWDGFRKAEVEKGDLADIKELHECTRIYNLETALPLTGDVASTIQATPPARPPTPRLKKAVPVACPPKKTDEGELMEGFEIHCPHVGSLEEGVVKKVYEIFKSQSPDYSTLKESDIRKILEAFQSHHAVQRHWQQESPTKESQGGIDLEHPKPLSPAKIVFGKFSATESKAATSEPPRVIFKAMKGPHAKKPSSS